jgi:hypothetical protein
VALWEEKKVFFAESGIIFDDDFFYHEIKILSRGISTLTPA